MIRNGAVESGLSHEETQSHDIWLISNRLYSDFNPRHLFKDADADRVIEYKISDLAKYMINPHSIEVTNRLVGCKIFSRKSAFSIIENETKAFLSKIFNKNPGDASADGHIETLISDQFNSFPEMKDTSFQLHINRIKELLAPYDTFRQRISELDITKLHDVVGVCEDPEGIRTLLNLNGTVPQKINYILNHLQKEIGVILKKAYLNRGLFELRGFDFDSYDAHNASRLVIVSQSGRYEAYVLTPDGDVAFHLDDAALVKFLHFFQSSLRTNSTLRALLCEGVSGNIRLLKLLFTKELEIDYFKADLPQIYREMFETNHIPLNARQTIVQALNQKQIGIVIKYLPDTQQGQNKPLTSVYVMHDVEALDVVKTTLPHLYTQLDKKLGVLGKEKYYLMDSMKA